MANFCKKSLITLGSGCYSVGRAVASDTRDPRLECSGLRQHRDRNFYEFAQHTYNHSLSASSVNGLKGSYNLAAVDCVNSEIENFRSLCVSATVQCGIRTNVNEP